MLDTRRPFTRAHALAAGLTPKELRGSRFRRLFHGVYVDARVPDHPLIRAQAALLVSPPSAIVSHTSAALVYELPVRRESLEHVTVPHARERPRRDGVQFHVGPTDSSRIVGGVRVSSPPELFVQLASTLSLVELVVVGDAMVRRHLATAEDLVAHVGTLRGRNRLRAQRGAAFVRGRVDSPMETRLRMLLVLAGLPQPCVNQDICDEHGRVVRRLDLSYPDLKIAIEYDGRHHIEREGQWRHDLNRREDFEEGGWRFLVITSDGIYRHPGRTVERVERALRSRGLAVRASDGWRAHVDG